MIKEKDLPNTKDLPYMFVESAESLVEGGYSWVGIDHFAKKSDELAFEKHSFQNRNPKKCTTPASL